MIQSPARYSPVRSPDETRMRRNTVLGTMVRDGHITLAQAASCREGTFGAGELRSGA